MAGSADNESITTGCICEIRIEFLARHEILVLNERHEGMSLCELLTNHDTTKHENAKLEHVHSRE